MNHNLKTTFWSIDSCGSCGNKDIFKIEKICSNGRVDYIIQCGEFGSKWVTSCGWKVLLK